jgi:hypothetical protein
VRARDAKVAIGRLLHADGQRGAGGGIQAEPSRPAPDREAAIEMPPDGGAAKITFEVQLVRQWLDTGPASDSSSPA